MPDPAPVMAATRPSKDFTAGHLSFAPVEVAVRGLRRSSPGRGE